MSEAPPTQFTAQSYQDARMASVPELYKTTLERLACELALRMEDADVIFTRYKYSPDAALVLMESPAFGELLARVSKEITETGLSFRTKARAIAEDCLPVAHMIVHDPLAPTSERVKTMQWVAKVGGLEPAPAKEEGASKGGGGLNLTITFAGQEPMKVVRSEGQLIEQEA